MDRGRFITFEGCEGSGKSTQSQLFYRALIKRGIRAVHTREPGGARLAERIRRLLLDPAATVAPLAELFLYEAARAQHMADIVLPALRRGMTVVCDRFTDATVAYQGFGRGLDQNIIRQLNRIATGGRRPDLTIYLDISPAEGVRKAKALKGGGDRLDRETLAFHCRVRRGYRAIARTEPRRVTLIRTAPTIEETHRRILAATARCCGQR